MKILITGGAGLIGSRFAEWIVQNHPEVDIAILDDLSGGYMANVPVGIPVYTSDAADPYIESIFKDGPITHIAHFAAYAAEACSPFIRRFNYTNNLVATANLINFAIKYGINRFLFTSSMAVYGINTTPFNEDMIPMPADPYGIAKFACEMDLKVAGEQHGLDWVILRPHNVYGRHQNLWDSYRNVLGIWMWKHMNGQPLSIFGDGLQKRAFSAMDDCLEPMWRALTDEKASKQIINLGGIHEYTINEAANTLIAAMGGGTIEHLPPRHEVKNAWSTWQKSTDLLGFEDKTPLYEGLKDMYQWALRQPQRERFIWKEYELEKGLYSYWTQSALEK